MDATIAFFKALLLSVAHVGARLESTLPIPETLRFFGPPTDETTLWMKTAMLVAVPLNLFVTIPLLDYLLPEPGRAGHEWRGRARWRKFFICLAVVWGIVVVVS
jgi:hypothetical protein